MNAKFSLTRFAAGGAAALALLAGCQKKEEPGAPMPASAKTAPAIVSAEKNSFDEVTSKLDKGGNFYLYLSTEQAMSGLSNHLAAMSNLISALPNIPGDGRNVLDKVFSVLGVVVQESGISQISGVGMSSIAREPGFYYNKVVVHHYPGQDAGLAWTLFGKAAHSLKILDMLPETTALATSADLDVPQLVTSVQHAAQTLDMPDVTSAMDQAPGKFKEVTGLDLDAVLHSLGGEYGIILTLDQQKKITLPLGVTTWEIPSPGLCLIAKVNSDLIFDRVNQLLTGNPLVTKVDEPDLKMRTMLIPIPIPVEVRPSIARVGDYLLVASSDNLVHEIVAVSSGKKNGFKTTEEFKRLAQGVPEKGNNFTLVSGAFARTVMKLQEKSMAMQHMDTNALRNFQELTSKGTNAGTYSVGANGPNGWEEVGNGNSGGQAMLVVPAAAVVGFGAALALPAMAKAKSKAQDIHCINNLRQIDLAKRLWADDNKKQSTDTPTESDLKPYLGGGSNVKMLVCPDGGVYTIGAVGEKPTCSIPGHVLP